MSTMASQITSLTIVCSTVYSRNGWKETSKLRVTGLCEGNSPVTGEFPAQRASNAENVSIWWRHHAAVVFQALWLEVLAVFGALAWPLDPSMSIQFWKKFILCKLVCICNRIVFYIYIFIYNFTGILLPNYCSLFHIYFTARIAFILFIVCSSLSHKHDHYSFWWGFYSMWMWSYH